MTLSSQRRIGSYFQVFLLGPFVVERDGTTIDAALWQRRVRSLFKLLAVEAAHRRQRDELIEILWPETDPESGGRNLRTVAHRLRLALGGGDPSPVLSEQGWVALNPTHSWDIDLHQFTRLAQDAGTDMGSLEKALALYRGEPLQEERYEEWATPIRDRVNAIWRAANVRLASARHAGGDLAGELLAYESILENDPIDEEAIRALLITLHAQGRPAEALRRYSLFERRLTEELGVPPDEETMEIVQRLHTVHSPRPSRASPPSLPVGGFLGAIPEGPMIGHDEELRRALAPVEIVEDGTGQVLFVSGETGIGKTRLAQEVMLHVQSRGFAVGVGRCSENADGVPLQPFLDALHHLWEQAPPLVWEEVRFAPAHAGVVAGQIGAASVAGTGVEPGAFVTEGTLASTDVYTLSHIMGDLLIRIAEIKPVAILLDDLHSADAAALDLLQRLAPHLRQHRVLILATHSEPLERDHPLDRTIQRLVRAGLVERLALARLTPESTALLVTATTGHMDAEAEFAEFVHRRTKGIPFHVREMLDALEGRYCLMRQVGLGGMGRIFEAMDTKTGQLVAAKIMFSRADADPGEGLRFQREGAALARLQHPNIVRVLHTFVTERAGCIVMEMLEGQSLAALLESQRLSLAQVVHMGRQVASALACAHGHGVIHRDIKPANIMVLPGDEVKVTDFGIARLVREGGDGTLTTGGMTLGTPVYTSPEQLSGREVDRRADIYALGAVLYEMTTGRPPFEGEDVITLAVKRISETPVPPSQLSPDLPKEWDAVILKALAAHPDDRYQTAIELRDELAGLSAAEHRAEVDSPTHSGFSVSEPAEDNARAPEIAGPLSSAQGSSRAGQRTRLGAIAAVIVAALFAASGALTLRIANSGTPAAVRVVHSGRGVHGLQLAHPVGVGVGPGGTVYFADSLNDRIDAVLPNGDQTVVWGSRPSAPGSLFRPHDVAVDAHGDVYVADLSNDRIQEFSPGGAVKRVWGGPGLDPGEFVQPTGITLGPHGDVFVIDSLNRRIEQFSSTGTFLNEYPVPPAASGEPSRPSDLAVGSGGDMYIADFHNDRIVVLSPTGRLLHSWGSQGQGPGQFLAPASVALDRAGDVYVVDQDNQRIQELSPSGAPLADWGSYGTGRGQFNYPADVTLDGHGRVYVADGLNNRIAVFSPTGVPLADMGIQGHGPGQFEDPQGVAVDAAGNIYVADTQNDVIRKVSLRGRQLAQFGTLANWRLSTPSGVAADGRGNVYVADTYNDRIEIISRNGVPTRIWGGSGTEPGRYRRPSDVAVDRHGIVYVADSGNDRVQALTPAGRPVPGWNVRLPSPRGLTVGPSGYVYVADPALNAVVILSPQGKVVGKLGQSALRRPGAVAVGRTGRIYVADTGHDRVVQLSRNGRVVRSWGSGGSRAGQFRAPSGLTVLPTGLIVVSDTDNNRIQEIDPAR